MLARGRITRFRLPLRRPLITAHGEIRAREGLLLELEDEDGRIGLGEAAPLPGFGVETLDESEDALGRLVVSLLDEGDEPVADFEAQARHLAPTAHCARAALDAALLEISAGAGGCSVDALLSRELGTQPRKSIPVNALLTEAAPEPLAAEARGAVARGFRTLKLKLGGDGRRDMARARSVRSAVGPSIALRFDANAAWKEDEARERLAELSELGPELVEQPIPPGDVDALARLRADSRVRLAADESVTDESSAAALLAADAVDALVLKPSVLGLRAATRIAARALARDTALVVTSFLDSCVGRGTALQLAAALPAASPAAGLATGSLLAADLGAEELIERGALSVPTSPGRSLDRRELARVSVGPSRELRR
jgi:o-succinylbenzoate synthase